MLATQENFNFHQLFQWGEHRRDSGWKVRRWVKVVNAEKPVCMIQALERTMPFGVRVYWINGGPAGPVGAWAHEIKDLTKLDNDCKFAYVRVLSNAPSSTASVKELLKSGWSRPQVRVRSGQSMLLRLDQELEEIRATMTRNWRHNLRRGEKKHLNIEHWRDPNIDEIAELYKSMQTLKGLEEQYSRAELAGILHHLGDKIVIYRCVDEHGQLIAIRGCCVLHNLAWDMFAAASAKARKVYASYVLFWELIKHCKDEGVAQYDLMGIDPEANPGVFNFKKGTGAQSTEHLGEWEWSSVPLLKSLVNFALKHRRA